MPTVYDVPASDLIKIVAEHLRNNVLEVTTQPRFNLIKTSSHLEHPPRNPDFWYVRCASILRKIYMQKSIGVGHLRKEYGGRTSRGTVGKHKRKGGGAIIRNCLKQLEKAGLVTTVEKKGRILTKKGISILDSLAGEVLKRLEKDIPELKKYR